jgi:hypothetical protein
LVHDFFAFPNERNEPELVAFGHFSGFLEAQTIDPKAQAGLDFIHNENGRQPFH